MAAADDSTSEVCRIFSAAATTSLIAVGVLAACELMNATTAVLSTVSSSATPVPGFETVVTARYWLWLWNSWAREMALAASAAEAELAGSTTALLGTGQTAAPESAALDANTASLGNVVIVNFFDQATRVFNAIWSNYVNLLRSYARAKSSGGPTPNLSGVGQQVGGFFGHQAPTINPSLIASDMQQVVDGLVAVADAQAASGPWATPLRVATGFTPKLASDLSEGIAEAYPTQYAP